MGAIASGGVRVLNQAVINHLQIPQQAIERVAVREGIELARREKEYRQGRGRPEVNGRTVILVDDGLATGSTMRAAVEAIRQLAPARVVVAVPTASPETCLEFSREPAVDEIICAVTPEEFQAVGMSYKDFSQTTDEQVHELLGQPAPGHERGHGQDQARFGHGG
jgi:predicted phosphoribosyltransferase